MSPSDLEVLIHYHCCHEKHPRHDATAVIEATHKFLSDGIIDETDWYAGYTTTEKGKAWLAMILKTPYPTSVQCWVDGNGDKIDV